jgi:TetR/AcrR family transcriptional regulator
VTQNNHSTGNTDVRARILREALALFGERGYEGTSVQAIADAVGIRKPSLLYHFSSKEDLREAVNRELLRYWSERLPHLLADSQSGHDRFAGMVTALVDFFREDENRARLAVRELLDRPLAAGRLAHEHLSPWLALLTNYLRLGQTSGVIKPEVDPESYVMQIMMMVIGTVAMGRVAGEMFGDKKTDSLEPRTAELVRIAREALFVRPAPPANKGKNHA